MTKIVLIGAGSTIFGLGTISDIFKSVVLTGATIVLHDIDESSLKKTKSIAEMFKVKLGLQFQIESTIDRREALKNADFCIISIEVGDRFKLWEQDWKIPLQYGFRQVYGENGGPGGLFHSLRIIPPIIDICHDIHNICPDAFVFNYSNPMQRICHAVTSKFPNLKFTGLCHEIMSMEKQLPILMETDLSNIDFRAGGLNHLSVLLEAKYRDSKKDGYPKIRENIKSYYSQLVNHYDDWHISEPGAERGVFFELYKLYGYLPITVDSHLGEYIQWAHSVVDQNGINEFYNNYKRMCLKFRQVTQSFDYLFSPNRKSFERVVPIIEAIIEDSYVEEAAVNLPNTGFMDTLSEDIVVEVPAIIDKNGVTGIPLNNYP